MHTILLHSLLILIVSGTLTFAAEAKSGLKRYLYASTPDGAQMEGRSGNGILVFDIDGGHKFVKRLEIPVFVEGLRGFTGNLVAHSVYYSTTSQRLGRYDVESERVVWDKKFPLGCDRSSVTPDGKKVYVPTGWWYRGEDSGFLIVDGDTGALVKRIPVGKGAHNSIVSLDGKRVYLGTETKLTVFDTATDQSIMSVEPVGEKGVFPYTIDSRQRIAYVCLGEHVGFDVVDLNSGKVLHRVLAGEEPVRHRTHGAGLTPDESELWISDQDGKKLFIFDATQMPPTPKGQVELSIGGHGWICFSLDGHYAWSHTPDVFDARTKQKVATLRDENGKPFASSKFIEIHFRDGKVVAMGNEFGLGRKH